MKLPISTALVLFATLAPGLVAGEEIELEAGDCVLIPKGWTGTWDTPGCTKIYVIHAPNKDL